MILPQVWKLQAPEAGLLFERFCCFVSEASAKWDFLFMIATFMLCGLFAWFSIQSYIIHLGHRLTIPELTGEKCQICLVR
jgi:hypothetical protein